MSDNLILSELYLYPVKSLRGIAVQAWEVDSFGLRFDRRWMVVDQNGRFLTQRQLPHMAKIGTAIDPGSGALTLNHPQLGEMQVPNAPEAVSRKEVTVWRSHVKAVLVDLAVDAWLSEAIGKPCRLVWFPDDEVRQVNLKHARKGEKTAFSDGYPFLLIGQGSLDDLNSRLPEPVSMRRFRPNLVVSGCQPYAEDAWKRIAIGGIPFRIAKPCSRCVVTTVDPDSGEKTGSEPLQTLFSYRKHGNEAWFGQNAIHEGQGRLKVGDSVEVMEVNAKTP
ncbi:MAG: hypothetical protein AXA67_03995 [Methylothermaceae bacteria B42]|nr:MAG: hypothetical protein AXA67_03995 [Methylothermaceae bacteria B42]HHJ38606.1 MOSC domain-containing protein [Methylothermaceae bacterium]